MRSQIAVVLPPLVSGAFVERLSGRLGIPHNRLVHPRPGSGDFSTSSLAVGLDAIRKQRGPRPDEVGILIGVGSGIQAGCATYYF